MAKHTPPYRMWQQKRFSTTEKRDKWVSDNQHRYQIEFIFINNGYGVEYRALRVIDIQ